MDDDDDDGMMLCWLMMMMPNVVTDTFMTKLSRGYCVQGSSTCQMDGSRGVV